MALAGTPKRWAVNSYTNSTWTDLVPNGNAGVVRTILVVNTDLVNAITCAIRLTDNTPTELAQILAQQSIAAGESVRLDLDLIGLESTDHIQFNADAAGLNFVASGAV